MKIIKYSNVYKLLFFFTSISICYVLVYNIINYDQIFGYDAEAHQAYINYISMYLPRSLELPTVDMTREFFSPPIPYLFPAVVGVLCRNLTTSSDFFNTCIPIYSFYTQIFQALILLFVIYIYIKVFKRLYVKSSTISLNILLTVSLLTVNYKTFAMIRGEPYILLFNSLLLLHLLNIFEKNYELKIWDYLKFGVLLGLIALSRQWGILLFPGLGFLILFIQSKKERDSYKKLVLTSFLIGLLTCGWFYGNLYITSGSITAFNDTPESFSFSNQNSDFYNPFNPESIKVFSEPIRPNFSNQLLPILYSDLWGDYWGYFSFTSRSFEQGRNQESIGDYLGKVNILSLIPTFLMILGLSHYKKAFSNKNKSSLDLINIYLFFSIFISLIGYLWFLIKYPGSSSGDTIKSTYMIQVFHAMALFGAQYLEKVKNNSSNVYLIFISLLVIVFVHNFQAMLSHFVI